MTAEVRQPPRAYVGNCRSCGDVIVVENDRGVWPLIVCRCGARDDLSLLVDAKLYTAQ